MVATPRLVPDPPDSKPGRLLFRNYLTVPYHEEIALREKREYLELSRTLKIKEIEAAEARATKRAERKAQSGCGPRCPSAARPPLSELNWNWLHCLPRMVKCCSP